MTDIDHTRDCVLPSDGKAEGLVRASELFAVAAERDALLSENMRLRAALERIRDVKPSWGAESEEMYEIARAALEENTND